MILKSERESNRIHIECIEKEILKGRMPRAWNPLLQVLIEFVKVNGKG